MKTMANIQFDYQYRDAGGSKACDSVIFANPDNLDMEAIKLRLERALWETEFFIADQIRIPELFLYSDGSICETLDHCFHTFDGLETTSQSPTDTHNRSIGEFIQEVEYNGSLGLGWCLFDPVQRFGR